MEEQKYNLWISCLDKDNKIFEKFEANDITQEGLDTFCLDQGVDLMKTVIRDRMYAEGKEAYKLARVLVLIRRVVPFDTSMVQNRIIVN
jgi:hypothetical protein